MILREYILSLGIPAAIFDTWLSIESDKQILGSLLQSCDIDHETVQGKETYAWYRAFAEYVKPKVIAEIGVRFGYTLKALGVDSVQSVYWFDNESYVNGSISIIHPYFPRASFKLCDTQKLSGLPISDVDIFHVDGDHTSAGAYHDLQLAFNCVRTGGWILIDDIKGLYYQTQQDINVRQAAMQFCHDYNLKKIFIPTYRGMYAIRK